MKRKPVQKSPTSTSPAWPSIHDMPFRELLRADEELAKARREHARKVPRKRRLAADLVYHGAQAERIVFPLFGRESERAEHFRGEVLALAIDPEYAPALLTVGTLEYELDRRAEALELLHQLTTLPEDTEDLSEIVDKAGDYLIDSDDIKAALDLYLAAVSAYPRVALFHDAAGYCLGKLGDLEKAVQYARQAVKLEPANHMWLNDLGWSLMATGNLEEAEEILERSVAISPPEYELARNNLEEVRRRRRKKPRKPSGKKPRKRRSR
ncbi:MAG: tetratricopeptide repeat protein [Candidatus Krumholzibacteriia bacterium]